MNTKGQKLMIRVTDVASFHDVSEWKVGMNDACSIWTAAITALLNLESPGILQYTGCTRRKDQF
jgi:hypothetical protein